MLNVYATQLSDFFPSAVLPQAMGTIWSYCQLNKTIKENYNLQKVFWQNEKAEDVTPQIVDPDVLICSCYVWNWARTYEIIKWVKENYPNCIVIIGGPEPEYSTEWMQKHSEVDVLIPYYGEKVMSDVLLEVLNGKNFDSCKGVITKNVFNDGHSYPNFEEIPSPYLNGFFDKMLESRLDETTSIRCVFESNRGCPYSCTFCDIGSKMYQKVKTFEYEVVLQELEWIVKNKINVVDVADANFGILPRDEEFVDYLIELKEKYNWKGRFLPTWSKARGDRVLRIAKKLIKSGLDSIFGLSLQSLNPETLKNIKRVNAFDLDDLTKIVQDMNTDGIDVYTELIFPMPGDTLENFKEGLYKVLDMPVVFNKFQINQLSKYSNAQFSDFEYNKMFDLKWAEIKGFTRHYHGDNSTDTIAVGNYKINKQETFEGLFFAKNLLIPMYYYGIVKETMNNLHNKNILSRRKFFIDLENKLLQEKWFVDFKNDCKEHYFNSIENKEHFGFVITQDAEQRFPEFAHSHNTFIKNNIYDYLYKWYPDYKDFLDYDKYSLWTGTPSEDVVNIKGQDWLFKDTRQMEQDRYIYELYIIGRFDDRWRKKEIRKV
jgi:radical SAM superfamily enzyme YgiQ (UPF0313 family)